MSELAIVDGSRGTVVWGINWFRADALARLLDDLQEQEKAGYAKPTCEHVQLALGKLVNSATTIPDGSWWRSAIWEELQDFCDIYERWNNHEGFAPEKVKARKAELRALRNKRNRIARKIRGNQFIIQNELDLKLIDAMYDSLSELPKLFPDIFKALASAIKRFEDRKP